MKSALGAFLVLVALFTYSYSQNTTKQIAQVSSVEQEIVKLEQEWSDAIRSGDKDFIQKLWAQDFILTNSSGKVLTKAQLEAIEKVNPGTSARISPLSVRLMTADLKVKIYSSTAIATGWIRFEEPVRNSQFVFEYRFTHVWVKSHTGWQVVAAQYTSVSRGLGPA